MARLFDVYKLKENSEFKRISIFADKFVPIEFAMPIEFYVEENKNIKTLIIVKEFFPERHECFGISTYSFTSKQFEDNFEKIGEWNDFVKD